MDIGEAEAAGFHLDGDLAPRRRGKLDLTDDQRAMIGFQDSGFHDDLHIVGDTN